MTNTLQKTETSKKPDLEHISERARELQVKQMLRVITRLKKFTQELKEKFTDKSKV